MAKEKQKTRVEPESSPKPKDRRTQPQRYGQDGWANQVPPTDIPATHYGC